MPQLRFLATLRRNGVEHLMLARRHPRMASIPPLPREGKKHLTFQGS
jgi:hypothetical protein